jgi:catechol 2,3-dioxygenase-like lactoylglutathione lyase family enzyme
VLNSLGNGPGGTINHLGVEVGSAAEVSQAGTRLDAAGLDTGPGPGAVCCYALQDKVWAHDPDGVAWEFYTVLEHIETP